MLLVLACLPRTGLAGDNLFQAEKITLKNGMTVIAHENHSRPLAHFYLWFNVGSKNEEKGLTGFAHFFEHYMFKGSKHVPKGEYDKIVQRCGGILNASTANDRTDYFELIDPACLEEVFRIESDRLGFLRDAMSLEGIEEERKIVKNEKRQSENRPHGQIWNKLVDTVYDEGHPYKWPVIGAMEDLDRAKVEDFKKFHETYYNPNNAVLVVSGDVEAERVFALARKWFEPLAAGPKAPKPNIPPYSQLGGRRELVVPDPRASVPQILIAYRIPGDGRPGHLELAMAAQVLAGGRSSRLVRSLQYEQRLAAEVSTEVVGFHESDLFLISAVPMPGIGAETIEKAVQAEIAKVVERGVSAKELDRVKAQLRTARLDALQSIRGISGALAEGEAVFGDLHFAEKSFQAQLEMGPEPVRAAAERYLVPSNSAVIIGVPQGDAQ